MGTEHDPASRGAEAARRAAELRKRHDDVAAGQPVTPDDVERAEKNADEARKAAAHAAHSAARSLENSARLHERVAQTEDRTVQQGVGNTEIIRDSAAFHRNAAKTDHELAELKRQEAEADEP
jgi:hypothetical protein